MTSPSTALGLLILILLLLPGFVYSLVRERLSPSVTRSAFRETASVIVVSVACNAVILFAYVLILILSPIQRLDLAQVIVRPAYYIPQFFTLALCTAAALVTLASLLAFSVAR